MLDHYSLRLLRPLLERTARILADRGVLPNQVTIISFAVGLLSAVAVARQHYLAGLVLILVNRFGDGIDGPLARMKGPTDRGAYLDIVLDFIFYSAVAFGFALADPATNALAAAALIFSFVCTGSSFLAFAIMAERRSITNLRLPDKGMYYLGGFAEGTETIFALALFCLLPSSFPLLAWIFALICFAAAAARIIHACQMLR